MTLEETTKLAMKILSKGVGLSSDKIEMATLVHRDGKTVIKELTNEEVTQLFKEQEKREKEAELAAAQQQQQKP